MTPRLIISILTFTLLFGASCGIDKRNLKVATNDTMQVLKLVIDSALYRQQLPEFSRLKHNNPFGDTIIFKFDSILVGHLPSDLKYKLLNQDEICLLATQHIVDTASFCNFIELNKFKKIGNGYKVTLKNQCVKPLYDKNGNQKFYKDYYKQARNNKCEFGLFCDIGIDMTIEKYRDTLKAKIDQSWITSWIE